MTTHFSLPRVVSLLCACSLAQAANEQMTAPLEKNLHPVLNAQFEQPLDLAHPNEAQGWQQKIYAGAKDARVEWCKSGGVHDSGCIRVDIPASSGKGSLGVIQELKGLAPDTMYRFRAMVKTQDVKEGRGAVIFDNSSMQAWNASKFMYGTQDWTPVYMDFYSSSSGEAKISCALGYRLGGTSNGGRANGVAYFDEVSVEKMTPENYTYVSGEYVTLIGEKKDIKAADAMKYARQLDKVYEGISHLLGGQKPYGGKKLVIMGSPGLENGYWALAGNPILKKGTLEHAVKQGAANKDLVFGVVHEMGHVFNAGGNFPGMNFTSKWNWTDELFANFRAYYGVKMANGPINFGGGEYKGASLKKFYQKKYDKAMADNNKQKIAGDVITYILIRLGDEYGWDVMSKCFQEIYREGKGPFANNWEKFYYILQIFEKHAGKEVIVKMPKGELDRIKADFLNK